MGLDIRLPIGLMFTLMGGVLAIFGMLSDRAVNARSLGYNVNLWWGLLLLTFGLVFIYFGRRGTNMPRPETMPEAPPNESGGNTTSQPGTA